MFDLRSLRATTQVTSTNSCDNEYDLSSDNDAVLTWSFTDHLGNPVTGEGTKIIVTPSGDFDITITVVATNPCGTTSTTFVVDEESSYYHSNKPTLFFSDIMTPNKVGKRHVVEDWTDSPVLTPDQHPAYRATKYHFRVYNRWGELIHNVEKFGGDFKQKEILWNGQVNGEDVPLGLYNWHIQIANCKYKTYSATYPKGYFLDCEKYGNKFSILTMGWSKKCIKWSDNFVIRDIDGDVLIPLIVWK